MAAINLDVVLNSLIAKMDVSINAFRVGTSGPEKKNLATNVFNEAKLSVQALKEFKDDGKVVDLVEKVISMCARKFESTLLRCHLSMVAELLGSVTSIGYCGYDFLGSWEARLKA
jgi:hypothetical protein